MSTDTVLARKWRPRQFSEVVGQEAVVRALSQALDSGRLHHAYLFTGTRGVGKTTLARIFAKALNCRQGLSSAPCTDDIAQSIDEGRFVDLIEIDAASKTKVEDTRELLDNVQYAPSMGRYKIYLIDEVHMLSTHSFNALLKTLEEPPSHVKFLLATTDPHKLPVTILSRCLQFHLRPMMPETLTQHLAKVLTNEGIEFDVEAITLAAKMAQGSVRDALSLIDQAIILGGGRVGYASTREMLGLASTAQIIELLQSIADQARDDVLNQLNQWKAWGADFDRLQQQLLEQLHELAMMQVFPTLMESALIEQKTLLSQISAEQVQIWLQVALLAKEDMQIAPSAQMGFEILLMRLLHFRASTQSIEPRQNIKTNRTAPSLHKPQQQVTSSPLAVTSSLPHSSVIPTTPPTPAVTVAPVITAPSMDFSLLYDMVSSEKKTIKPVVTMPNSTATSFTDNTQVAMTKATETQTPVPVSVTHNVTPNNIATIDPFDAYFADSMSQDEQIDDHETDNSVFVDDQTLDFFAPPPELSAELTKTNTITLAETTGSNDIASAHSFSPYSVEEWREQLAQWRLNPMQLGIAERCVRLISDDPNKVLLACPPAEEASLGLMRDKLGQAITRSQPNATVSWVSAWHDNWLTLQRHALVVSEQERMSAQQDIANDPTFMQVCQKMGLVPQWDKLIPTTP